VTEEEFDNPYVLIRPRAAADIESQAIWLEDNASAEVVQRFRVAVMEAVARIADTPGAGSPRHVTNQRLSGFRMWKVRGFRNHLLFYITSGEVPEVIRLLHGAQDVDRMLKDEE
jgi:toxin ParE1/3/4